MESSWQALALAEALGGSAVLAYYLYRKKQAGRAPQVAMPQLAPTLLTNSNSELERSRHRAADTKKSEKSGTLASRSRARRHSYSFLSEDQEAMDKASRLTFSWMGWAPEFKSVSFQALHEHFPGALPGSALYHRTRVVLTSEEHGLTPSNTLFGHSICPDEINHEHGNLCSRMADFWSEQGKHFPLGGIGGAPFVGKTGFMAFSHHVPENGNILIVFGPHIAISESGELGKYQRDGQTSESSACGAVLAGYKQCCSGCKCDDTDDMQQAWIRSQLKPHCRRIQLSKEPMVALVETAYDMVAKMMNSVVNTDFGQGKLVLIGGILINLESQDHFLPKMFEIRTRDRPTQDLMDTIKINC